MGAVGRGAQLVESGTRPSFRATDRHAQGASAEGVELPIEGILLRVERRWVVVLWEFH